MSQPGNWSTGSSHSKLPLTLTVYDFASSPKTRAETAAPAASVIENVRAFSVREIRNETLSEPIERVTVADSAAAKSSAIE